MRLNEALIHAALRQSSGANVHKVSNLIAKYRLATAVGDDRGQVIAEIALRDFVVQSDARTVFSTP